MLNQQMSPTIETFTGVMFNILNPTPDMIDIKDIAHAGSQLCRFTGHTKHHYSIAQHELLGSYLVPKECALEFLLHDAAESYVNDMSRPLKHMTKLGETYRPIEDKIQSVIRQKFGLPVIQTPIIHTVDNMMLWAEKKQLMFGRPEPNNQKLVNINTTEVADVKILEMSPRTVESFFLMRFKELQEK